MQKIRRNDYVLITDKFHAFNYEGIYHSTNLVKHGGYRVIVLNILMCTNPKELTLGKITEAPKSRYLIKKLRKATKAELVLYGN